MMTLLPSEKYSQSDTCKLYWIKSREPFSSSACVIGWGHIPCRSFFSFRKMPFFALSYVCECVCCSSLDVIVKNWKYVWNDWYDKWCTKHEAWPSSQIVVYICTVELIFIQNYSIRSFASHRIPSDMRMENILHLVFD